MPCVQDLILRVKMATERYCMGVLGQLQSTMSRKRALDRILYNQSAEDILDEEDQELLIETLNSQNRQTLTRNRRCLALLLLVELIYVLVAKDRSVANLILNVSILLSWIGLFGNRWGASAYQKYIKYVRRAISAIMLLTLLYDSQFNKLHCILPSLNTALEYIMLKWYSGTEEDLMGLNKIRYKYKNV